MNKEKNIQKQTDNYNILDLPFTDRKAHESNKGKQRVEAAFLFFVIGLVVFVFGYHCPIRYITGIDCPGCGMTRALLALLKGDLAASIAFHPFLLPSILLFGMTVVSYLKSNKKAAEICLYIWSAGMLICWIIKLVN